jgi:integrase
MWYLQKQGRTNGTIQGYRLKLTQLMREGVNLSEPESVKEYLAQKKQLENSKFYTMAVYDGFLKFQGISWQKPNYRPTRRLPFLPTEDEINSLIACSGKNISALLLLLKETGMRLGKALGLRWTDIDNERNAIILNMPEKHSEPRIFKVTKTLLGKLEQLPKTSNMVFVNHMRQSVSQNFRLQRKRIAIKLGNPRLMNIHFHTLRHWKATMEYAKTRDILHVMQVLGHRNIKKTLIYTQLVKMEKEDNYYSATAKTATEAKDLIESGVEYVCTTPEEVMVFRKRKYAWQK